MIKERELLFEVLVKWDDKIKKFCEIDYEFRKRYKSTPEKRIEFIYYGLNLAAIVDRIDENDNEICLIDYKTSKNASKKEEYIYEFQTTFYYLWAKSLYPNKEIKTYIWDLDSVKMVNGIIKEDILKEVLKNLPNRVSMSKDIVFEDRVIKKAKDICYFCPYKVACGRDE